MKGKTRRGRSAVRAPREIRVRMTSPRAAVGGQPDKWVVNGRVIRFLDPCAPDDGWAVAEVHRTGRLGGIFGALRHPRRKVHTVG